MQMSKWLTVLLTLPAAFAQQQTVAGGKVVMNFEPKIGSGCPIGVVAKRQGAGPAAIWTIAQEDSAAPRSAPGLGERPRAADVGVQVQVSSVEHRLKQVDLSIAYQPYGVHYTPVQHDSVATYYRKTFRLAAEGDTPMHLGGHLLVGMASGVTRVYVTHVVYGDGTEWSSIDGKSCSVVPSMFLPVDGAAR